MITFKIEINSVEVKRVDIRRMYERNKFMDENGYDYKVKIYDFQKERFERKIIIHKIQDNEGILLMKALENGKQLDKNRNN